MHLIIWPGPLTVVLPVKSFVYGIVTSGFFAVGMRMSNNHIALEMIKHSKYPIAAPSANKFGQLSHVSEHHVKKQFQILIKPLKTAIKQRFQPTCLLNYI